MKKSSAPLFILVLLLLSTGLTSCDAIAGIFEAGIWTGVVLVVAAVAVLIWLGSKLMGRR